jgi:hypothetical protein
MKIEILGDSAENYLKSEKLISIRQEKYNHRPLGT